MDPAGGAVRDFAALFAEPAAVALDTPVVSSRGDAPHAACFACMDVVLVDPLDDWPAEFSQEGLDFTVKTFSLCDGCAVALKLLPNGATIAP